MTTMPSFTTLLSIIASAVTVASAGCTTNRDGSSQRDFATLDNQPFASAESTLFVHAFEPGASIRLVAYNNGDCARDFDGGDVEMGVSIYTNTEIDESFPRGVDLDLNELPDGFRVTHYIYDSDGDHICGNDNVACDISGTLRFDELSSSFTQNAIGSFRSNVIMQHDGVSRSLELHWKPFEAPDNGTPTVCNELLLANYGDE